MAENTRLLELALKGLETERSRIDREIKELTSQLNGQGARSGRKTGNSVVMSRAAGNGAAARKPGRRGVLTAAGRKRLSEAAKKRWAANRKTGKTTL